MKTTVEIPDDLLRKAKARAALEGIRLNDFIAESLREKLRMPVPKTQRRRRTRFPIVQSKRTDAPVTMEQVNQAIEEMDMAEAQPGVAD